MTALALGDEHPPLGEAQVTQPQPEDLTAAQPAQHHRRDHGPVPVRAQRGGQHVNLGRAEDLRQRPGHPDQRDALAGALPLAAGRQAPRHRVHAHVPAGQQEPIQSRHARQPPSQRPGRHPAPACPGHLQTAIPASALSCHERQHVNRADPPRRLRGRGEEDLQVIGHGQHRVRPAPASQELQVLIQQPDTQPHHDVTGRIPRPRQADNRHWHAGPPHLHKDRPVSLPRSLRRSPAYHA